MIWLYETKPKYQNNAKLFFIGADSFIININTEDVYEDISDDIDKRFDKWSYEVDSPLPTAKNKKVIGLMKDE